MPQAEFSAQISDWVAKTQTRMKAVRDESVQRVVMLMQTPVGQGGNMPVDTGFLRASLMASIGSDNPNMMLEPNPGTGQHFDWDESKVTLTIQGADFKDTITIAYGANYAVFQEYGTSKMQGHRFVGLAAQQWPQIVDQVCREAQERFS